MAHKNTPCVYDDDNDDDDKKGAPLKAMHQFITHHPTLNTAKSTSHNSPKILRKFAVTENIK